MPGKFDVAIIGGGVVGRAIALELSRYQIRVAVLRYVLPAKISGEAAVDFTMRPWKRNAVRRSCSAAEARCCDG